MSQNRRDYRQNYQQNNRRNTYDTYDPYAATDEYIYGNTVRKPKIQKEEPTRKKEAVRAKKQDAKVRKNRERAHYMSAGYVLFLAVALCTAALILVNYIQLQTELTNLTRSVAAKEIEVNNMKMANDEEYNRIISSIDLEEIKRIALGELGMIYAQEGQIISYDNKSSDYMRQVTESSR